MYDSEKHFKREVSRSSLFNDLVGRHEAVYLGTEVDMGRCIPDIVFVCFEKKPNKDIIPYDWTLKHSFVFYYIRKDGPISISKVSQKCFSYEDSVKEIVHEMEKKGLIEKGKYGYKVISEVDEWGGRIIGVELKLHRWSRAVKQAENYREFSNSAYVVMPEDGARNAKENLDTFRSKGVGLSVIKSGEQKSVLPAEYVPTDSPRHQHLQVSGLLNQTPNWLRYESNASSQA